MVIYYQPLILRNLTDICSTMGVGADTVKAWVDMGAPIAVEGTGVKARYSAEAAALQSWRLGQ